MRYFNLCHGLCALALATLLSSCGSKDSAAPGPAAGQIPQAEPQGALLELPRPAELLKTAATTDDQRWLQGSEADASLPYNLPPLVGGGDPPGKGKSPSEVAFSGMAFSPQWDPAASATPADLAYATYVFNGFDTYTGSAQVLTSWQGVDLAKLWVGLANFQTNHWDWYNSPVDPEIDLPGMAQYTAPDGRAFVVVLLVGTSAATLDWVLLGDAIVPDPSLLNDAPSSPMQCLAPLSVAFDASDSYAIGSHITLYELDFDGDGTYEDSDSSPFFTHIYAPGIYHPTLRITDNLGQQATRTNNQLHVINPSNQAPTASFTPIIVTNNAPLTVSFDASSSMDPDGQIVSYEWDFDADGAADYTSSTPDATYTFCREGANNVALQVTDSDLATDDNFGQVICSNGWRLSTIASGLDCYERIGTVAQGSGGTGRICVAYMDSSTYTLHFARSSSSLATGWTAPVTVAAGNSNDRNGHDPSIIIESVSGVPAIAYGRRELGASPADRLMFVRATGNTGAVWNAPVIVDSGSGLGLDSCLQQFNGKLTIASIYKSGYQHDSEARVYQATDSSGSAWNAPTVLVAPYAHDQMTSIDLINVPGHTPLVGWSALRTGTFDFDCIVAVAQFSDAALWFAPTAVLDAAAIRDSSMTLGIAGGRPALCLGGGSTGSRLKFNRADDADGFGWTGGYSELDGSATGYTGDRCSMGVVGGKPAIAYLGDLDELRYIAATDAAGSAWNAPQVVDSAGDMGKYCSMAVLNNLPVIAYSDSTNSKIKAAVLF